MKQIKKFRVCKKLSKSWGNCEIAIMISLLVYVTLVNMHVPEWILYQTPIFIENSPAVYIISYYMALIQTLPIIHEASNP